MANISIPLTPHLEETIDKLVKDGYAPTKSEVVRKAITRLAEEEAVRAVLRAEEEPTVRGDLRKLMKKL